MRSWAATFLKLIWGIFLVLTSIYCLLAFLPYTYFALIKAPAYSWMPWFAHHHRPLYWLALLAAAIALSRVAGWISPVPGLPFKSPPQALVASAAVMPKRMSP